MYVRLKARLSKFCSSLKPSSKEAVGVKAKLCNLQLCSVLTNHRFKEHTNTALLSTQTFEVSFFAILTYITKLCSYKYVKEAKYILTQQSCVSTFVENTNIDRPLVRAKLCKYVNVVHSVAMYVTNVHSNT